MRKGKGKRLKTGNGKFQGFWNWERLSKGKVKTLRTLKERKKKKVLKQGKKGKGGKEERMVIKGGGRGELS